MIENTMFNIGAGTSPLQMKNAVSPTQTTPGEAMNQFGSYLADALEQVNAQEQNVHKLNDQFLIGKADVDQVMVAGEKSMLSLQLTAQIRNKAIEAYQEIMRTQM
ncbi:flagellar hook-basal body complex protein FliE [Paenibacillus campi]|uniref:flagellar hook-basal body complex protein FliE n=1 Tax=Paenibacillus campi TaxID=3106031 RepID=UPI002AFFC182|nr:MULTISPECIES: flagellar hook-basal body complex protein FliE [unclassified Paenibacillus]